MKRLLQIYGFVVLATTILLALLKLASFPGVTWGWVALPILGPFVLWLLFMGLVTTVGLIWPPKTWKGAANTTVGFPPDAQFFAPIPDDKYRVEMLKVTREFIPEELDGMRYNTERTATYEQKQAYYRKALALDLATLAHDTPGFIQWEKRGETLIGELKILVRNE